jgi:hypothetical protein
MDDVRADEVHHLGVAAGVDEAVEIGGRQSGFAAAHARLLDRGEVAHRRVHPHVEVLVGLAGDLETEIRCVARHVPTAQAVGEPFLQFVDDFRLQPAGGTALFQPCLQQ